jgi:hypothetical protein
MHESIIEISKATNAIREAIERIEHGVISGTLCSICGGSIRVVGDVTKHYEAVDCAMVPLEVPKSCDKCFIARGCISSVCNGSDSCKKLWNKIIDHHKK